MTLAEIFVKLLNMTFTGTVVILIVLLARLLLKKLPKKYVCILWTVVLIRLLCPFTLPTLVTGQPDIPEPIPSNIIEVEQPYIHSEVEVIDQAVNHILEENFTANEEIFKKSMNPLALAVTIGGFIWIAGVGVMLIYTAWNLRRFSKWIEEAVPDKESGERVYRCFVKTPVVTGLFNPRIYLSFSLKEAQIAHVLSHEKMHIQRKDHLLKLLFYIAVIIHWFNPFVWLAYRFLERDMEMACDEAVLEMLGTDEKKKYCESLLDLASSKNHFVGNPVAFGESDVKVRIRNLLNYKKPYVWASVLAIIAIFAVAVTCLSSSKDGQNSEPDIMAEMTDVKYPLTKEVVDEAFAKVDLPGLVSEEEYASEIRTSMDIRDEDNRLIAAIASNGDGEKRFLGITWIGYLRAGAASVYLPEEKWKDMIGFATLLAGFENQSIVYNDFIENYEHQAILTEYQYDEEPYTEKSYEWLKSYGDLTCQIEVKVATDGTKEISGISFFNTPEYGTINSEMAAKTFFNYVFLSMPERHARYVEATDGKYNPTNIDKAFLESDYSAMYLNHYKDRVTQNCLQTMEDFGYFTLVDYLAAQIGSQVRFYNATFTQGDDVNGDKDVECYRYTATLTNEKDGEIKKFDVQGMITVANMLNGWKVTEFQIGDPSALSMYITGYRTGDEAETKMVYVMDRLYYCTGKDVSKEVIESLEQISIDTPYIGTIQSVVDYTFQPKEELQANFGTTGAEVVFYGSGIAVHIDGKWIEFTSDYASVLPNDFFSNDGIGENSFVNLCLSSFYDSPKDVDLEELFYNGFGLAINDSDRSFLEQQNAELDHDVIKLPKTEMNNIMIKYFGISLDETNWVGIEKFYYNEDTDIYYLVHSDFHELEINVLDHFIDENGNINVVYSRLDDGKECVAVIEKEDESYRFLSNMPYESQ